MIEVIKCLDDPPRRVYDGCRRISYDSGLDDRDGGRSAGLDCWFGGEKAKAEDGGDCRGKTLNTGDGVIPEGRNSVDCCNDEEDAHEDQEQGKGAKWGESKRTLSSSSTSSSTSSTSSTATSSTSYSTVVRT
ncbi:hypothetical protein CDV31_014913 [Fusarium ambrosium]|uniref:Uncharacterized protein n=1 Tax=Fusarium ambrosium TaxID=131363 RepID=A0A428ST93_9HYPO|nr:hypothetical protein CDV31_014913 [Fusarium ambrosium]